MLDLLDETPDTKPATGQEPVIVSASKRDRGHRNDTITLPGVVAASALVDRLTGCDLDQQHSVSVAWQHSESTPAAMSAAYSACSHATTRNEAYGLARMRGACPGDAETLADGWLTSQSPNGTREAWVDAAELMMMRFEVASLSRFWVSHAAYYPDPIAGVGMVAGAVRTYLATLPEASAMAAAREFTVVLHAGARPDPRMVAASVGVHGFVFGDRFYVY